MGRLTNGIELGCRTSSIERNGAQYLRYAFPIRRLRIASGIVVTALAILSRGAAQPALTTLYNFTNGPVGCNPYAGLIGNPKVALYGASGWCGDGSVFELTPPISPGEAWKVTVLHSFGGSDGDGPAGKLAISRNGLYGTTSRGGIVTALEALGTVFEAMPPAEPGGAWTEAVLHTFTNDGDGDSPVGGVVIGENGVLYGSTYYGGTSNYGTVFGLTPPAAQGGVWTEAVLHNFTGGGDGRYPAGGVVIGKHGELYGTTFQGGSSTACSGYGCGIVFQLTPPAKPGGVWTERVLHAFTGGHDGAYPAADLLIDANGDLFGVTSSGGDPEGCSGCGYGTVFELTPAAYARRAWAESVLWRFTGENGDGSVPLAGLTFGQDGALYGTTSAGGVSASCRGSGCGTVFKLKRPAAQSEVWTETVLHRFTNSDGAFPQSVLLPGDNGLFYGTTTYGGSSRNCYDVPLPGCGTLFELRP